MLLTVLTDNYAGGGFLAEHGLSFLIESEGQKVLFDTGHTDVFLKNAAKLEIDIRNEVNTIILSHGHWDHGNGLSYMEGKKLITHPSTFMERFRANDHSYIGIELSKEELAERYNLVITKEPHKVSKNIFYLGEIPRVTGFESKTTPFINKKGEPDFVPDDSAVVVVQNNELIVISGCAHAGICNTILYAQELTGVRAIRAVVGGFHLKKDNKQTRETIRFFKQNNVKQILPSHCTSLEALCAFSSAFNLLQVTTGKVFNFFE